MQTPQPLEPWLADALGIPRKAEERDDQGRFRKGCKPGPGRPKGALDFGAIARAACEANGQTLEDAARAVFEALFIQATVERDVGALRMIADRIFGRVPKEFRVELDEKPEGPSFPQDFDPDRYAAKLAELAAHDYSPAARAKPPKE